MRSHLEILANIILSAKEGARKTHVMHKANLSFEQLDRYLFKLVCDGLLVFDDKTRIYRATQKGLTYVSDFAELKQTRELVKNLEKGLKSAAS